MLRIRNWDKHYETSDTRKLVNLNWVKLPNQHDTLEYRLISKHERGAEIFAAWVLMVQVASRAKRDSRGFLPYTPEDLSIITGFPADIFAMAIEFLKSPKIGWIEESPDNLPSSPDNLPESPDMSGKSPGRIEGNGMEEKDKKERRNMGVRFAPPTLEQVQEYCTERRNNVNPSKFVAHYESNGWRVGKNPMKDWKAAVRTWEGNDFGRPQPPAINSHLKKLG